ncbi:MAG TPA: type II secretion system protein GspJ [Candidatus Binataceae bacterium]|nr:type II secretion system protein GspJ [Candidatus Binataceae bacterium]
MKFRNDSAQAARGFTLIELMLAIFVLGLVLVMLAGSFSAVSKSKLHAESHLFTDREGRAVLWQISNEIRGAVQTPLAQSHVLLLGTASSQAGLPINSLTISTLDPGHRRSIDGFGTEDIVSYAAVPNPNHRGWFILERTQQSGLSYAATGKPVIIADDVVSMRFRYFDGQQWTDVWNSQNMMSGSQLPVAITIDLQLGGGGQRIVSFSTQVTVPMAIGTW